MIDFTDAEYSAIGCILIEPRCLQVVRELIPTAEMFCSENCRKAFETCCTLADDGKLFDPVIVAQTTDLDRKFLMDCMELVPSCYGAEQYARYVRDGYRRRQLHEIGSKLVEEALFAGNDTNEILSEARTALDTLGNSGSCHAKTAMDSLTAFLQFRADVSEGKRSTIKTGFPSVDGILGGMVQGGLYVIAARPGVGKTAFSVAIADMIAKNRSVLFVYLEMTENELNARRIAAVSNASFTYSKLMFGKTTESEDVAVIEACSELYKRKLRILEASRMTVSAIEIEARNTSAEILMIDYLSLIDSTNRKLSEYERVTQISGELKRMAKRLNIPVICMAQLNRESVSGTSGNTDRQPKLSQLRSSGAIEQDADAVMLIHRPEYGQTEVTRNAVAPQQFYVIVAKNRHGRTGTAELQWIAPVNRFIDEGGRWTVKSWT